MKDQEGRIVGMMEGLGRGCNLALLALSAIFPTLRDGVGRSYQVAALSFGKKERQRKKHSEIVRLPPLKALGSTPQQLQGRFRRASNRPASEGIRNL